MKEFLIAQKRLFILLFILIFWLFGFYFWSHWITKKPLDSTISLAPKGVVSEKIQFVVSEPYTLALAFERTDETHTKLRTLLGRNRYRNGQVIPSGTRIPIRWSLKKSNTEIVASGESESFGSDGWSATQVFRRLGHIKVDPGTYIFDATILRDIPELEGINTKIVMMSPSKSSSTWQFSLVWWASIINVFLVWPVASVIILMLLWRSFRFFRSPQGHIM